MTVNFRKYSFQKEMQSLISEANQIEMCSRQDLSDVNIKIEAFFKKALRYSLNLRKTKEICPSLLQQTFKRIESVCKSLHLEANRTVHMFYKFVKMETFPFPKDLQTSFAEFLTNAEILKIRKIDASYSCFADEIFLQKINEGTCVKELGFSEPLLKSFLSKYGKSIHFLNLKGLTLTDQTLFDSPLALKKLTLRDCVFNGLDLSLLLKEENVQKLEELDLSNIYLTRSDVNAISQLVHLKKLNLSKTGISSKALCFLLENMLSLESLNVSYTPIGDEGLIELRNHPQLKELNIESCLVTKLGMAHIQHLLNLESLNVSYNSIEDEGIEHLQYLRHLKILCAHFCHITSEGVSSIQDLPLDTLNISNNWITNDGIRAVQKLNLLRKLDVAWCGITERSIHFILGLPVLQSLNISYNPIRNSGIKKLRSLKSPLKELYARKCRITELNESFNESLLDIEALDLSDNFIQDKGINSLKRLKKLKHLRVRKCGMTDFWNAPIHKFFPKFFGIETSGMATIGKFLTLETLDVSENLIGDLGLKEIETLIHLKNLSAICSGLSDQATSSIDRLFRLESIDLSNNSINVSKYKIQNQLRNRSLIVIQEPQYLS